MMDMLADGLKAKLPPISKRLIGGNFALMFSL